MVPKGYCLIPMSLIRELERKMVVLENMDIGPQDYEAFRKVIDTLDLVVITGNDQKE